MTVKTSISRLHGSRSLSRLFVDRNGCFQKSVGVLMMRTLLFGVYVGAPGLCGDWLSVGFGVGGLWLLASTTFLSLCSPPRDLCWWRFVDQGCLRCTAWMFGSEGEGFRELWVRKPRTIFSRLAASAQDDVPFHKARSSFSASSWNGMLTQLWEWDGTINADLIRRGLVRTPLREADITTDPASQRSLLM